VSSCFPNVAKIKIQSSTGKPIQLVELQALSDGINVALGKSASQSSTFVTRTGKHLWAFEAVDGDLTSFSRTNDNNAWLEVDLKGSFPVNLITIFNHGCTGASSNHPMNCLCALSEATLSLLDDLDTEITAVTIGNTCGRLSLEYVFDAAPGFCSPVAFTATTRELTTQSGDVVAHHSKQPTQAPWKTRRRRLSRVRMWLTAQIQVQFLINVDNDLDVCKMWGFA
jgi:hypothetical protein